ncbi:iron-sulfur cluster assembly enzyme nifu [Anaeramoeba ignava]|uniref:Iron-sulfur cluster assembly protein n=1 Tax=Anaeramoeba ignava TaxID=1746090 RepID=A0A9Q0LJP1_ANAIG|nr:iron-sulfur cluster assembly enzyme nifu [Anaeramoeba ignava]
MLSRVLNYSNKPSFKIVSLKSKNILLQLYHEKVIDHYENPRNVGTLDKKKKNVGTGLVGAPACGDVMRLQIEVDDQGKIKNAVFKTFGCGSAIASSSFATELIKGKSIDEALGVKNSVIANELSLPPVKLHCSMLAEDAIRAAVKDFQAKNPGFQCCGAGHCDTIQIPQKERPSKRKTGEKTEEKTEEKEKEKEK